ncbi:MAG: DNA polymerase I [Nannocystaceae bacterium]
MATSERIILVDGSSLIYRAFFAIPANFTTSSGLHTNAIYGFATMFRKILAGRQPERGAVIFDAPGATFRDAKYPDYKAQRPSMPDELREQLAWIDKVVEAHRFPLLRVPGYEADDVIGTLTKQAVAAGMEVQIISGDKDFAQLLSGQVVMIDTLQGVTYDPELARKKWGVPPAQFVDFLALMGDKVDNIPGVPGIGKKGAAQLLETYGSLAGILANTDALRGRQQKNLREFRAQALLSQELATIHTEVPLEVGLDDLKIVAPETTAVNEVFRALEFYSLLSEEQAAAAERVESGDFEVCGDVAAIAALLAELPVDAPAAVVALHDQPSPVTGALAALVVAAAGRARLVPLRCAGGLGDAGVAALRAWLEDPARPKITYNAKWLWVACKREGVDLRGITGDVLLESFLVDPTKIIPHRVDQVIKEYLHRTVPPLKRVTGSGKSERALTSLRADELRDYGCVHATALLEAWPKIRAAVVEAEQLDTLHAVDLPLAWILGQMELDGIAVDPASLSSMGEEFAARLADLERQIYAQAGRTFNIGSTKQLATVLFDELGLPVIKRTKSGYSTNAEVLERLVPKHPIAGLLLEQRKLAKLINTYTEVLQQSVNPATGRIHATFQQTVGATGRLITTDPDLQRTPVKTPEGRRIRQTFVAPEGTAIISADWSQIELRLLAHYTGDPALVEAFAEGLDVHRRTAGQLFGVAPDEVSAAQRGIGKLVNFATIYGQGATALAQIVGVTRKEAQGYIDGYFRAYSGVREWLDKTVAEAHQRGYVTTLLGRRRLIPELSSNSTSERQAGERIAANTPIQGSAADLCKLAMLEIAGALAAAGLRTRMLLQIHDELVFEAPLAEVAQVEAIVRAAMESVRPLRVPLVVNVGAGASWADAH